MEHKLLDTLERYENCREALADLRVLHKKKQIEPEDYEGIRQEASDQLARCEKELKDLHDRIVQDAEHYRQDYETHVEEMKRLNHDIEAGRITYPHYDAHYGRAADIAHKARRYYNWWRRILACKSSADLRLFLSEAGALEEEALLVDVSWVTLLSRVLCGMAAVFLAMTIRFPWARTAHGESPMFFALSTFQPTIPPYWLFVLFAALLTGLFAFWMPSRRARAVCSLGLGLSLSFISALLLYRVRCDMPGQEGLIFGFAYATLPQVFSLLEVGAYLFVMAIILLLAGGMIDIWTNWKAGVIGGAVVAVVLAADVMALSMWGGTVRARPVLTHAGYNLTWTRSKVTAPSEAGDQRATPMIATGADLPFYVAEDSPVAIRLVWREKQTKLANDYNVVFERLDAATGEWQPAWPHTMDKALVKGVIVPGNGQRGLRFVFAPVWPVSLCPFSQAGKWRMTLAGSAARFTKEFTVPEKVAPEELGDYLYRRAQRLIDGGDFTAARDLLKRVAAELPAFSRAEAVTKDIAGLDERIGLEEKAAGKARRITGALAAGELTDLYGEIELLSTRYGDTAAGRQAEQFFAQYRQKAIPLAQKEERNRPLASARLVYPIKVKPLNDVDRQTCAGILYHAARLLLEPLGRNDVTIANDYLLKAQQFNLGVAGKIDKHRFLTEPDEFTKGYASDPNYAYLLAMSSTASLETQVKRLRAFTLVPKFAKDPRMPEVYLTLGTVCVYAQGDNWAATYGNIGEEAFREVLKRAGEPGYAKYAADAKEGLGITLARKGQYVDALDVLYSIQIPAEWTPIRRQRMESRIGGIRKDLGWGKSLGGKLDRLEVAITREARMLRVDKPERLDELKDAGPDRQQIVILSLPAEQLKPAQLDALRRWVRSGGALWMNSSAAKLFDLPVVAAGFNKLVAHPTRTRGNEVLRDHAVNADVTDVTVSGTDALARAEGVLGRPILEVTLARKKQFVCWIAETQKGKIIFLPVTIDRSTGDGSRFVFNLKMFSMGKEIPAE